jgi:hypothetical protein
MLHILLHAAVPLVVAITCFRQQWQTAFLLLLAGMIIDVDHLLAEPIYAAQRCSIGFHPLHGLVPAGLYLALLAHERTRLFGLGLCIHLALDAFDCQLQDSNWITHLLFS